MMGVREGRLPPAPAGGRAAVTGRSSRRPGVLPPIDPFSSNYGIKSINRSQVVVSETKDVLSYSRILLC